MASRPARLNCGRWADLGFWMKIQMSSSPPKTLYASAVCSPIALLLLLLVGIWFALNAGPVIPFAILVMALVFVGLAGSARYFHRAAVFPSTVWVPQRVALGVVVAAWLWQEMAFHIFIPDGFLTYGFFLKGVGRQARFHIIELPVAVALLILIVLLALAVVNSYRAGVRWSLVGVIGWWCVLALLFYLPTLNWTLQGDAAIFI
jgi:hypothetical protein